MRNVHSLLCGALFVSTAVHAATLIPVPPVAGAVTTNVFDITDDLQIVGSFIDAGGAEHGFFGPLGGSYTTFDFPDAAATEPRSINRAGYILGYAPDAGNLTLGPQYLRAPDGSFVNIQKDGVALSGIVQGLALHQVSTGSYSEDDGQTKHGYLGKHGKYKHDIDLGVPTTRVNARDIDGHGNIVGFYADAGGDHGFLLNRSGLHSYDLDASGTTTFEGLSEKGIISGQVLDDEGGNTAFSFDPASETATFIEVPGATSVQAWGINRKGMIAVTSDVGPFIYCPLKPSRCPAGGAAVRERKVRVAQGVRAPGPVPHREPKRGPAR